MFLNFFLKKEAIIDLLLHNWIAKNRVRLVLLKKEPLLFSHRPSVCPKSASSLISQKAEVTVKRRQKWEREREKDTSQPRYTLSWLHSSWTTLGSALPEKEREGAVCPWSGVKGWVYKSGVENWRETEREREWMGRGEEERKRMSWFKLFL